MWQEGVSALQVMGLTRREQEVDRVAERVDQSVDLGAQSPSAEPNGFVPAIFFLRAPALC